MNYNINIKDFTCAELSGIEYVYKLYQDAIEGIAYWRHNKNNKCYKCKKYGHIAKDCDSLCPVCYNKHSSKICLVLFNTLVKRLTWRTIRRPLEKMNDFIKYAEIERAKLTKELYENKYDEIPKFTNLSIQSNNQIRLENIRDVEDLALRKPCSQNSITYLSEMKRDNKGLENPLVGRITISNAQERQKQIEIEKKYVENIIAKKTKIKEELIKQNNKNQLELQRLRPYYNILKDKFKQYGAKEGELKLYESKINCINNSIKTNQQLIEANNIIIDAHLPKYNNLLKQEEIIQHVNKPYAYNRSRGTVQVSDNKTYEAKFYNPKEKGKQLIIQHIKYLTNKIKSITTDPELLDAAQFELQSIRNQIEDLKEKKQQIYENIIQNAKQKADNKYHKIIDKAKAAAEHIYEKRDRNQKKYQKQWHDFHKKKNDFYDKTKRMAKNNREKYETYSKLRQTGDTIQYKKGQLIHMIKDYNKQVQKQYQIPYELINEKNTIPIKVYGTKYYQPELKDKYLAIYKLFEEIRELQETFTKRHN